MGKSSKSSNRTIILTLAIVIIVLAVVAVIWHLQKTQKHSSAPATIKPIVVHVAKLKKRVMAQTVSAYGTTVSPKSVAVAATTTGLVTAILVQPGEVVTKGQILFHIHSSDITNQLLMLKSHLDNYHSLYQSYIKTNQAVLGAVARKTINQAKADYRGALASYQAAKEARFVKAPITGVVSDTGLSVGAHVQVGDILLSIIDNKSLQIKYTLPSQYRLEAKLGQAVTFTPNGSHQHYAARVVYISPQLDATNNNIILRANFKPSTRLVPHVFGQLVQVINAHYLTFAVQQTRIQSDEQGFFLYVIKSDKVAKQYIKVGNILPSGYVVITQGIDANSAVVMSDTATLSVGQHVKVAP